MFKLDMHMWSIVDSFFNQYFADMQSHLVSVKLKRTRFPAPDVDNIVNTANDRQFFKG